MSALIYRGYRYSRTTGISDFVPKELIYRGVKHDGSANATRRTSIMGMSYRGIGYLLLLGGQRVAESNPGLSRKAGCVPA